MLSSCIDLILLITLSCSIVRAWLAAAYGALVSSLRQLEASFLLSCKGLMEAAPANSWQMQLFSALATGPLKNSLLRFYAEVGAAAT